ncbi:hypothetical protein L7750_18755 [Xenorhabdus bovienii]|uniref:hypothetical protein n=1 Tax=Xenorhabdus bovienii TaxID=40576 RepID=UPI001EDD6A5B|nr:hypothetical protein [Xenorhabdus bovienii]MCG3472339.1 hypothetical protein [Xenorhabdus bovienii]
MKKYFFTIGFSFVSGCDDVYRNNEINKVKELYGTYSSDVKTHCDLYCSNMNPAFQLDDRLYVSNGYSCSDGKIYFVKEEFTKDTIPVFSK